MTTNNRVFQSKDKALLGYGKIVSLTLAIVTLATFALAMMAIPISGSNAAPNNGFNYPFLNTLTQFPRDFLWQYLALAQLVVYLVFIVLIRHNSPENKRFFSGLANNFALIAVTILAFAYYTQVMVVPASLAKNQADGLALLIQYNPHGLFIALEELGYLMMGLSLLCLFPLAGKGARGYRPIKIVILISSTLTLASLVAISAIFGLDKQDRFEIAAISIDWLCLIVLGFMFFRLFGREEKAA